MAFCSRMNMATMFAGLRFSAANFEVPIYCNALTAEAIRGSGSLDRHRNWRIFRTGAEFSICDIVVQSFSVPHDAVDPIGFAFYAGWSGLGFITDLGYRDQDDGGTAA